MKNAVIIRLACLVILSTWFFSHIPFFSADPDLNSSPDSRGPWTDEGLNTVQIRNYVNHQYLDVLEADSFLKAPLFSAIMFIPYSLFGAHLEVARLTTLFFVTLSLFIFFAVKKFRSVFLVLMPTTLMLLSIHQHSHFALAEMIAVSMILVAGLAFVQYRDSGRKSFLWLTFLFLFFSVLLKSQFLYALAIPLFSMMLENFSQRKPVFDRGLLVSIIPVLAALLLLLAWYIPFKNEFVYVFKQQSATYTMHSVSLYHLMNNIIGKFLNRENIFFGCCFLAAFILAWKWILQNKISGHMRSLLVFALVWNIVELHKLPMSYLPVRYLVPMYFSMGLTISIVFSHVLSTEHRFIFKTACTGAIGILIVINMLEYYATWHRRTFVISELNQYFAGFDLKDKTIIGPWSSSLTWESKSISIPVWQNFLRTTTPLKTFNPFIVISEPDEEDSGRAYFYEGIDLTAISDSIKETKIAFWKVNIYWINQQRLKNL